MDKEQTSADLSGETWRIISRYSIKLMPFLPLISLFLMRLREAASNQTGHRKDFRFHCKLKDETHLIFIKVPIVASVSAIVFRHKVVSIPCTAAIGKLVT